MYKKGRPCNCCEPPVLFFHKSTYFNHHKSKELVKARIVFEKESMSEKKEKLVRETLEKTIKAGVKRVREGAIICLLYTSPSPRD